MGKIFSLVLHADATIAATLTGATHDLSHYVDLGDFATFDAYLSVGAATGTSPTLDAVLHHSPDGVVFYTGVAFTQATGATTEKVDVTFQARYLRLVTTIGGSTPSFINYQLWLTLWLRPGGGAPHT